MAGGPRKGEKEARMAVRFRAQHADGPRALAGHPVQLIEVPDQRAWLADPATMHGKAVAMAKLVFDAPTQVTSIEICLLPAHMLSPRGCRGDTLLVVVAAFAVNAGTALVEVWGTCEDGYTVCCCCPRLRGRGGGGALVEAC